jgi:RNA polymerase sigma-70 factor, ECF subfamily
MVAEQTESIMNVEIKHEGAMNGGAVQASEWVQAAQSGSLSAFNQLVLMHQDGLYRWVCSLVSDEALAGDITQSTFITAFQKIHTYRGGSFRAWLFTIARNRSFDELRRNQRCPTLSLNDLLDDGRELLSIIPDSALLPEDALVSAEQSEHIMQLLNLLPETYRQVLWLVDIEELDYQEAADILSIPLGTIKSRLSRARLKLRHLLSKQNYL